MRHLRSILYALVLAPAVWVLAGVGFTQDLTGRARDGGSLETATAMLLLLLAGAAYAILIFAPISPAGPALSGLAFLGVGSWALIVPNSYAGVWPAGIAKDGFDLSRPGYALAVMLAVPMLGTALSARRWARYEPPEVPIFGTIGRARGNAPVAGTSIATEQTAVISTGDPTEMIALPTAVAPPAAVPAPAESPTEAVPTQPVPTQPVPTQPVPTQPVPVAAGNGDEPTAMMAAPAVTEPETAEDEPTTAAATSADEPTAIIAETPAADDEPTAPSAPAPSDDEPTALVADTAAAEDGAAGASPATSDDEPTAATVETAPAEEESTASSAPPASDDEPTAVLAEADADRQDEGATSADEPTVAVDGLPLAPDEQGADGAADSAESAASAADVEETTAVAVSDAPEEEIEADEQPTAASASEATTEDKPAIALGTLPHEDESAEPTHAPAADEISADATAEDEPTVTIGTPPSEDEPTEPAPAPAADATTDDDEPTISIGTLPTEDAAIELTPTAAADVRSEDASTAGESGAESAPASDVDEPDAPMEESTAEAESEGTASSVMGKTAEPASPEYDEITEPIAQRAVDITEPDADDEVTAQQDEPTAGEDDDAEATPQRDDEVAQPVGLSAPAAEPAQHAPARSNDPFFAPVSSVFEEDDTEKTQVIRLSAADESTHDGTAGPGESTRDIDLGGTTRVIGPGERTQIIFRRDPAELAARAEAAQAERDRLAQVRARQAFRDRAAQERARQAFAARAAEAAREVGVDTEAIDIAPRKRPDRSGTPEPPTGVPTRVFPDGDADDQTQVFRRGQDAAEQSSDPTQVFRRSDGTVDASRDLTQAFPRGDRTGDHTGEVPGDQTQVIPLGIGTVEPPGDQTQVLRFPTSQPPGENTTTSTSIPDEHTTDSDEAPTRPSSIVGQERPDPGADPTTRLGWLQPDRETTVEVGGGPRPRSVLDLERPADEAADDTTRLVPGQRRPQDEDSEASTHRL